MASQMIPASELSADVHQAEAERLLQLAVEAADRINAVVNGSGLDALSLIARFAEIQTTVAIAQVHTALAGLKR